MPGTIGNPAGPTLVDPHARADVLRRSLGAPALMDGAQMRRGDPLAAPGNDGWTPAEVRVVRSGNAGGFLGSVWSYAVSPVAEQPGQRLSTAQVDAVAPYLADLYGLPEAEVREHLSSVYLYVGGPMDGGHMALTSDHHIFVPDEKSLRKILSPDGKRWLVHELAHTMQFAAYADGNRFRSMSNYIKGMVTGIDPEAPGTGSGRPVWGAIFTGLQRQADPERDPSAGIDDPSGMFRVSVVPSAVVGGLGGLGVAAGVAAVRHLRGRALGIGRTPTLLNSFLLGATILAAPMAAGAWHASTSDRDNRWTGLAAAAGGGAIAAAGIALSQRFGRSGTPLMGPLARRLMMGAGVAVGAGAGWMSARMTQNTLSGWSRASRLIAEHQKSGQLPPPSNLHDAIHDSHWMEVDAEAAARGHARWQAAVDAGDRPRVDAGGDPGQTAGRTTFRDRLDWGLYNPLILGLPASAALGGAILGVKAIAGTSKGALHAQLAGAAAVLAPLVIGGATGSLAQWGLDRMNGSDNSNKRRLATLIGTGIGTGASMMFVRLLNGPAAPSLSGRLLRYGGFAAAGALALLAASASVRSTGNEPRMYRLP